MKFRKKNLLPLLFSSIFTILDFIEHNFSVHNDAFFLFIDSINANTKSQIGNGSLYLRNGYRGPIATDKGLPERYIRDQSQFIRIFPVRIQDVWLYRCDWQSKEPDDVEFNSQRR